MDFRKFYLVCICALLSAGLSKAAVNLSWLQVHDGTYSGYDSARDIAADSAGNVYVTGSARNAGSGYDIVTIKYAPDGAVGWVQNYSRTVSSPDYAMAIAVDANANVISAGYGYTSSGGYDGLIVKYNSAANQLWAAAYNSAGTNDDRFYDVVVDAQGNVYAVGKQANDCLVVKYTPNGTVVWTKTFNGTANGVDALYNAAVDSGGNLYVCGEGAFAGSGQDCLIIKYAPDGTRLWYQTISRQADGWDLLEDIAVDSLENIYVVGSAEDANGSDYITAKYDGNGNNIWTSFYDGPANGWDEGYAITVASDGHIAVTGYSESVISSEAATVKYNAETGSQIWAKSYDSALDDYAVDIAADDAGNVYITGIANDDYITVCYNAAGSEKWTASYNGTGAAVDEASAITVFGTDVYVTGKSMNAAGNYDYLTIQYSTAECLTPPAGDLNGDCVVNFLDFEILADGYSASLPEKLTLNDIADTWLQCGFADANDCFL